MFARKSEAASRAGEGEAHEAQSTDDELARVLLIDGDTVEASLVASGFRRAPEHRVEVVHVTRMDEAEGRLEGGGFAAVLLDLSAPDGIGLEGLAALRAEYADLPLVALTTAGDLPLQARAFDLGAVDCVAKDELDGPRLAHAVAAAIMRSRMQMALDLARRDALASEALEVVLQALLRDAPRPAHRRTKAAVAPAPRELHEARAEVASRASELQARAHVVDAAVSMLRESFDKMREIVRGWSGHREPEAARLLLLELMEGCASTLTATHHEVVLIERTSSAMIRRLGRGRVYARHTLDGLVHKACERVRERLPAHVRMRFEGGAPGVLVESGDEVVALTENLLRGIGGLARQSAGMELEIETHARSGDALLAVTLHAGRGRRDIGAKIVEAIVSEARDGYAELAAATRELRALAGGLRVGERTDGAVHLELYFPSG